MNFVSLLRIRAARTDRVHICERMAFVNRLGSSMSPYLQQHKDNPVDWWEWGEDAFAEARRLNKPVLLSVGYAACDWCHVSDHRVGHGYVVAKPLVRGIFRAA
jgi:uncharacterized protein YyaL (SSP411 family)